MMATNNKQSTAVRQPKSWELRRKDPNDYRFADKSNCTLVKQPGEINGEQFLIERCVDCRIYVLDNSDTIYVDDCYDCQIFLGPIESSVFLRDCTRCKVVVACGQFRTRNCTDIETLLMCQSQPIIESSLRMGFGCFRAAYPELEEQLVKAKIDRWNNTWSDLFDFTPRWSTQINHYYMTMEDTLFEDYLPLISTVKQGMDEQWERKVESQVIPFTSEKRQKPFTEEIIVIFFPDDSARLNINLLTPHFQPLQNQQVQQLFVESDEEQKQQDDDDVIIDAAETLPFYLVKAKNQPLYLENYVVFKQVIPEITNQAHKLLAQIEKNGRLQRMFSLYIRTDDPDIHLQSYLSSLISVKFNEHLANIAIILKEQKHIQLVDSLIFANMQDEKGGIQMKPNK